jgi:Ser/Thr protein kinase RdoA (MazF antagonist)
MNLEHRSELARPQLEQLVGGPLTLEELKHKQGRRLTLRVTGARGSAIVKLYSSRRASTVAARVEALAAGPVEPLVPRVLLVDRALRLVALSDLRGSPLRFAALAGDWDACHRAGFALGTWHRHWRAAPPPPALAWHTAGRELELLRERAATAPTPFARAVLRLAPRLTGPWPCPTVVHRDLYEEQLLLGERVALIDLDDAALGPSELDLGNLMAHLDLLAIRTAHSMAPALNAILAGYAVTGAQVDRPLLERCRRLSQLRLACIHRESRLLEVPSRPRAMAR